MEQLELPWPDDQGARRDGELLTIAEAAQRVRCCERTIRRAIKSLGDQLQQSLLALLFGPALSRLTQQFGIF